VFTIPEDCGPITEEEFESMKKIAMGLLGGIQGSLMQDKD